MTASRPPPVPLQVFIAYSHSDVVHLGQLVKALQNLVKKKWIVIWHDNHLTAGAPFKRRILEKLRNADIVLLLVSKSFLESGSCLEELSIALTELQPQGKIVVPVILDKCDWHESGYDLEDLEALPDKGKPVCTYETREIAYAAVKKAIEYLVRGEQNELIQGRIQRELDALRPNVGRRPKPLIRIDAVNKGNEPLDAKADRQTKYIVEAESGAGKTEWLHELVRSPPATSRAAASTPWYLHLSRIVSKLHSPDSTSDSRHAFVVAELIFEDLEDLLSRVAESSHPQTIKALWDKDLVARLECLVTAGRLRLCLDGLDQIELTKRVAGFLNSDICRGAIIATRHLPAMPTTQEVLKGYERAHLDRVSMARAKVYLVNVWSSPPIEKLRETSASRKLLRLPLFLQMLGSVLKCDHQSGNLGLSQAAPSMYQLLREYWRWATYQEANARHSSCLGDDFWSGIERAMKEAAWRLALKGTIDRFTSNSLAGANAGDALPPGSDPVTELLAKLETVPGRWDLIHESGGQYQFKHQIFQEYFVARAIAEGADGLASVQILAALPEQMRSYPSFWIAVMELLPGAFEERLPANEQRSAIWDFAQRLICAGQPLLAWVLTRQMRRNVPCEGEEQERHWRYVIFQLVRYRLDIDRFFPSDPECWHYDTLPSAVAALGRFSSQQHRALQSCLRIRLRDLKPLDPEILGIHELIFAWSQWDGAWQSLDEHRIAIILNRSDSAGLLTNALAHYMESPSPVDREERVYASEAHCTCEVRTDQAILGEWLRSHCRAPDGEPKESIRRNLLAFEDEDFDQDFLPEDSGFVKWMVGCFLTDFSRGEDIPVDVSLSLYLDSVQLCLPKLIERSVNNLVQPFFEALGDNPSGPRFTAAMVLVKGMVDALRVSAPDRVANIKIKLAHAFDTVANPDKPDHFSGFALYHEYSRVADSPAQACKIRTFVLRFFGQEIRFLSPYLVTSRDDKVKFFKDRMSTESYRTKRWLYFLVIPFLDPWEDTKVDGLLEAPGSPELSLWEEQCRTGAIQAVKNLREVSNDIKELLLPVVGGPR